ncbi:unnamed protein product [Porites evermanni]|uniref:Uncharacterized protein n=1 Tax=Porites evermanni TaxID=104178 RepID=A0ABN8LT65_9CNID|nr:unnamed protein product [Porites evermanni]
MATCGYSTYVGGSCGSSFQNPSNVQCVPLGDCQKEVKAHIKSLNVRDRSIKTESQLLLARAGIFDATEETLKISICPRHRDLFGIYWRCNKQMCSTPTDWAPHKSKKLKGDRGLTFLQSKGLHQLTNQLLHVGTPICKQCRGKLKTELVVLPPLTSPSRSNLDFSTATAHQKEELALPSLVSDTSASTESAIDVSSPHSFLPKVNAACSEEGESNCSDLLKAFGKLAVDDDQSVVEFPDEGSSSSESSDGCHIDLQGLRREKLNQFLTVCGKEERVPGHPKKSWEKLSNQRKNIYVTRATTAIVTALEVIAPGDAGHLWTAVQSSRYITSLFKQVHITQGSRVADHCAVYALSDPKEDHFQGTCDHAHDQSCSSCEGLDSVLSSIEASVRHKTSNLSDEERDDMMYSCQQAVQAIHTWKAHQLRVLQQDKCRIDVLQELNFNEVLITQDWAMKFLPLKYRETQTDWFGKRGISWHISVVVRRETGGNLQHQAFVHIAKNCSQDSNVVAAIMEHILRNLSNEHPEITTAYFRQDNAGCYKSAAMLAACPLMQKTTGINVRRVDFSDPQGGKGSCDRKAATIKAHVRRFVNEGHDVLTADDFRDAILSNNGVRGVRVAVVNCEFLAPAQPVKWEGVSSINNLSYQVTGVTVWKAYDVGKGKTILRTQLQGKVKSF